MCIVALGPFVLFIYIGAETSLIRVDHELFEAERLFVGVEVSREPPISHQMSHCRALLGAKWQGIYFLLLLVEWLDSVHQVAS